MNLRNLTLALAGVGALIGALLGSILSSAVGLAEAAVVLFAVLVGTAVAMVLVSSRAPQRREFTVSDNRPSRPQSYATAGTYVPEQSHRTPEPSPPRHAPPPSLPAPMPPAPQRPVTQRPAPPRPPLEPRYAVHPLDGPAGGYGTADPDDRSDTNGTADPKSAGWWNQQSAAPVRPAPPAVAAPKRAAPELGTYLESAVVAQCPNCGEFRVDVEHSGDGYAFGCPSCAHRWSWVPGEPWPRVRVDPRRRAGRPGR